MDNAINIYYRQAQFSLAAYADLAPLIVADVGLLKTAGMGTAQADAFAQTYEVVDRYDGMVLRNYMEIWRRSPVSLSGICS